MARWWLLPTDLRTSYVADVGCGAQLFTSPNVTMGETTATHTVLRRKSVPIHTFGCEPWRRVGGCVLTSYAPSGKPWTPGGSWLLRQPFY